MSCQYEVPSLTPWAYGLKPTVYSLALAFLFVCALSLSGSVVSGAESGGEVALDADFRRIFVPVDSPEEWPIGKEHYLPISKSEFSRLIEEQGERRSGNNLAPVQMAGGTYHAKLVDDSGDDSVLVGSAELVVQTSSELPRLLPLSPLNLTVTSTFWDRDASKQAELGIWQRTADRQDWGVLVSQSDTLHFDWQLRAIASNSSSMDFNLQIPVAVPQTFALVLPKNYTAALNSGELFRTEDMSDGKKRWWFQLAPTKSHQLRILRQLQSTAQKTTPLVAQTTSYDLEPDGMSFLTSLHFDSTEAPTGDLRFTVSSEAKILSVSINQQTALWRIDNGSDGVQLVVERKQSRLPLSVEIRGIAQIQFDQPWQLPVLRPREVSWAEGTTSLWVSPELELRSLVPRQASLQQTEGLDENKPSEEVYRVQEWSEDASLEVVVSRRSSRIQVRTATTIDIDPKDLELGNSRANKSTAQTVAEFSCKGRPTYQIEAEVSSDWSIESVKSVPLSALGEWHILENPDRKLLRIQLNEPILPDSPLRLEIASSARQEGALLPTTARELLPLRFLSGQATRRLLLLRSRQRGQMELLHGLVRSRLETDEIDSNDATLLPELGDGVLLDLVHLDKDALVELSSRSDRYHAEVNVDLRVLPNSLDHHYRLDCSPISGVVSEIIVQFDRPLPDTSQWELVGHRGGVVSTRIDQIASESTSPDPGPTYRLQLPVVVDGPFSLQTQYSTSTTETQPCNLLYLPESPDWRGQVAVHGPLDSVRIDDRGWTPIAPQEAETAPRPHLPLLGCYRLGADQTKHSARFGELVVSRTAEKQADANLFAWLADIHTLHSADGATIYVASYFLENSGSTGADIELPLQAVLQEAWLGQQHFEPREILADNRTCRFHFDNDSRYPTLVVQYVIHGPELKHSATIQPPLPECSFPINLGRWTLWMPEQYVVSGISGESASRPSWSDRLFGPLSRSTGQSMFNPFRVDNWQKVWPAQLASDLEGLANTALPTHRDSPWTKRTSSVFAGVGHCAATVEFVDDPPSAIVHRSAVQRAQWHVIWLLTLTLSIWLFHHHANELVLFSVITASACLVVSSEWLLGLQAILMGLLSAFVLHVLLKKQSWNVSEQSSTQLTARVAALTLLLCAVLLYGQASAESTDVSPSEVSASTPNHLYRVLFPIDSKGNPQSDDVYVSESFLKKLKNAPGDSTHDGAQSVLLSALYRGGLPIGPQNPAGTDEILTITLETKSFVSNSEIDLPFRRDEAEWLEDAHRLDGFPVEVVWNSDGNGCKVNLGAAGAHRLELIAKPKIAVTSSRATLKMHVPRFPQSSMDFSVPAEVTDLKISSAGQILIDNATGRWQAPLSGDGILQMDWTAVRNDREPDSIGEVEQLAWLHVGPSAIRLDVQIRVQHPAKALEFLILKTSPRLKLLPRDEEYSIEELESTRENSTMLRLKLKSGAKSQTDLQLQFQLQRSGSLGRIFYPQIQVQGAGSTRSLFAVSVSQGLSYEESLADDVRNIAATKFATRWGSTDESPLYAYSQTNSFPKGSLRVWPDPKSMTVQQSMRVHCELKHAHVEYEAAVDEITGSWLTHRLWVPDRFTMESVSVSRQSDMEKVPVRWSRVNKSQIVLFLGRPLQGPHVVSVRGHVDTSREGELTLPALSLVGTERSEIHVDLSREADVLVNWIDLNKAPTKEEASQSTTRERRKIPVGRWTWRASGSKDMETLRIEKNDQQFAADTLTTIAKGPNGWTATLHSAIHIQRGVLSHVTLAVPNGFQQPYRIEPAGLGVEGDVRETASGRQITFLLTKPIPARDTFEIQITGGLDLPPNQRLEVPHLRLVGSTRSSQYVLLPISAGKQPVEWNWTGLKSKALPKNLSHFLDSQENSRSFLIEQPQFFAQERSYQGQLRNASLRYALIAGTLDQQGNLSATAELVLQPGRATHCTLRLPAGAQLKQLATGDSRVRRERIDDRSWRIPLGPPFLPRKIKVVYRTKTPVIGHSIRLSPPEILIGDQPLPHPQTLWQIYPAGSLGLGEPLVGHTIFAEQFARSAHQLPLKTLDASRLLALELPIQEGRSWFQPWQRNIQLAWDTWRAHDPSAKAILERAPTLLGSNLLAEEQSDVWSTLVGKLGESKTSDEKQTLGSNYPPALPARPTSFSAKAEGYFMSDQQGQLVLAIEPSLGGKLGMRFLAGSLIAGGITLARHLKTRPDWLDQLCNRPQLVAFVVGLLWWLFLTPSAGGMLVVLGSLLSLAIRKRNSRRRRRTSTPLTMGAS